MAVMGWQAIAALGNRRPSLQPKITGRVLSRNRGNSQVVKPISGQHECGVRASLETTSSDNQFEDDVELNNRRTFLFSSELLTLAAAMTPLLLDAEVVPITLKMTQFSSRNP